MSQSFSAVLQDIRLRFADDVGAKGRRFEEAVRYFLKNDPYWCNQLQEVWPWAQAPQCDGQDYGIDIVAQDDDDSYWAIQCKCWNDDATLSETELGTFFSAAVPHKFAHRMIVATCDKYSKNLDKVAKEWNTVRLGRAALEESNLDWEPFLYNRPSAASRCLYQVRPHQKLAIEDCLREFKKSRRGQLIMACGTGKTLTSLRLAEQLCGRGGKVLFLAPSIALVSQAMRFWANQAQDPLKAEVVCSDISAAKTEEDAWENSLTEMPFPPTTDAAALCEHLHHKNALGLTAIFATYQSIEVIHGAQELGLHDFDLIICDEAHRTAGAALQKAATEERSHFVRIHDGEYIRGEYRLYMTATPKVYGEKAKRQVKRLRSQAQEEKLQKTSRASQKGELFTTYCSGATRHVEELVLSSMDNADIFGSVFHKLSFHQAIEQDLLSDYRAVVQVISEEVMSACLQEKFADEEGIKVDEQARIIGCWKALANPNSRQNDRNRPNNTISADPAGIAATDLADEASNNLADEASNEASNRQLCSPQPLRSAVAFCNTIAESKRMAEFFTEVVDKYIFFEESAGRDVPHLRCETRHIDGTMNSSQRRELLKWLAEREEDEQGHPVCHILFNARCLAEGVDVPSLDAVLFLRPKKSQIDVIQAVGRVMRKAQGKKYGYILLPIVIPIDCAAEEALDKSEDFAVVWSVAKALRSHDERMEAIVNSLNYDVHKSPIEVHSDPPSAVGEQRQGYQMELNDHELQRALNASLVKKCGTRVYWEDWAKDIADIATKHIDIIRALTCAASANAPEGQARAEFVEFWQGLRRSLNENISEEEAVEMLAQHVITLPVFEALFKGHGFAQSNPVSQAMEKMIAVLQKYKLISEQERRELEELYDSIRRRCEYIESDRGRQKLMKELYENFFQHAFKRTAEKMGIVYTPTEVVDYILHATDRLLQKEFGQRLADENVHILDPFTGTGTFIQRLIASQDLIPSAQLPHKYLHELHCNEIMLLAYYIATINIEHAYHQRLGGAYQVFPGAVLTDTFQLAEAGHTLDDKVFGANTERAQRQNALPVRVILGNPPYSAGQKNSNDNNQNEKYATLDGRIAETYAKNSASGLKKALYDSYIRAFRWASDRIGEQGIIAYVSNGGWLRGGAAAGFRRCLVEEFNGIYVFDLRGNQRTQGEQSRREGGKIFGSGSRAPIAITLLVKNPAAAERGVIRYCDIGDYLSQAEKLAKVAATVNSGISDWKIIHPDAHGDWLEQRDDSWQNFLPLGINKLKGELGMFAIWSLGIATNRDVWSWSFDKQGLSANMRRHIAFYERERQRYAASDKSIEPQDFVTYDAKSCKWTRGLWQRMGRGEAIAFDKRYITAGLYRPFCKQWSYYQPQLIEMTCQMPKISPPRSNLGNLVICMNGVGDGDKFSCLISDHLTDLHMQGTCQCFPLYYYERSGAQSGGLDLEECLELEAEQSSSCAENGNGGLSERWLCGELDLEDVAKSEAECGAKSVSEGAGAVSEGVSALGGAVPEEAGYVRKDAITDATLATFRSAYPRAFESYRESLRKAVRQHEGSSGLKNAGQYSRAVNVGIEVTKEDIFFYVYALLHSPQYRRKYANNLTKELPRIPLIKDFVQYSLTGRQLANLHLNYETCEQYPLQELYISAEPELRCNPGRVQKMRWGKKPAQVDKQGKKVKAEDRSVIVYNENLTLAGIPEEAHSYVVNGRSALDWLLYMYQVKTDKDSGIVSDPNLYSENPRYLVELIKRVTYVAVESVRLIESLPEPAQVE